MAARVVAIRNDQEIYCAQTDEEAQKLLAAADGMEMNEAHVRSIFTDEVIENAMWTPGITFSPVQDRTRPGILRLIWSNQQSRSWVLKIITLPIMKGSFPQAFKTAVIHALPKPENAGFKRISLT